MAQTATLAVAISARGAVQGARQYTAAVKSMTGATAGASAAMGGMRAVAAKLFAVIGGYVVFRNMTSTIMDFQDTMAQLEGVTGATADQMREMETVARELGATTRFTAAQAGEGLLALSRAGFEVEESTAAIAATLDLATAGMMELGEASEITSKTIRQFGLEASDAERVADVLTNTANSTNSTIQTLGQAMSFAGTAARSMGIDVEETAAALGVLMDAGIDSGRAGRALRQIMIKLVNPSKKAQEVFKELGITWDEVNPEKVGLVRAMERLREANIGLGEAAKIFDSIAATAGLALTQNIDKVQELTAANREAEGVVKRNAELIRSTFRGAWLELISTLQEVTLRLGEAGLTKALTDATRFMTSLIRVLVGIKTESKGVSDNVLKVAGAIQSAWAAAVKLKNVFLAIVGIHLAVKLVNITVSMVKFGQATLLAAGGVLKMAAGIGATLVPIIGILGAAILAIEFGRWLESLEPVQKGMQHVIFWIAKKLGWLSKVAKEAWLNMRWAAITFMINPTLEAMSFWAKRLGNIMVKIIDRFRDTARALGMDDTVDVMGRAIKAVRDFQSTTHAMEVPSLVEGKEKIEAEYQAHLNAMTDAHSNAINKIVKKHKDKKEDMTFVEFMQADITKVVDGMGLFKDKTAEAQAEVDGLRQKLEQAGQLTVEMPGEISMIVDMWNKAKNAVTGYGQRVLENLGLIGEKQEDNTEKAAETILKWEDMVGTLSSGLTSLTMGAKGFEESVNDITDALIRMALQKAFESALSGGATVAAAKGMVAMASGGVVQGPTPALIGEAGPEAVIPLSRNERGELGIAGSRGGGDASISFNMYSPDARGIKNMMLRDPKLIQQMNQTYRQGYAIG